VLALQPVVRLVVFAVFALALLVALAQWLVRTRRVSPISLLGRALRALSDPVTRPIERRVVAAGGNPVHSGWWLVIGVAVAGVVVVSLFEWLSGVVYELSLVAGAGPRALAAFGVTLVYHILVIALAVRIIGTWVGMFQYSRWMRPAYLLTDWLVEPIRRAMPQMGMFDWSPVVAWLVLWVLEQLLLRVI